MKEQSSPFSAHHLTQAVLMESFSASTNSFSVDLYKKLDETSKGQNIFFAPWSIATALAMVHLGAKGDTAMQIAKVSSEISSVSLQSWLPHDLHYSCLHRTKRSNMREQWFVIMIGARNNTACRPAEHCSSNLFPRAPFSATTSTFSLHLQLAEKCNWSGRVKLLTLETVLFSTPS